MTIKDTPVSGLLQGDITTTNYFSADTFSLTLALPRAAPIDLSGWASHPALYVTVTDASSPPSANLITGIADLLTIDPILRTISIEGRGSFGLASSTFDSQLDFVNQTASEIVAAIAEDHGLAAQVTATSGNVGRYFGDGFTKLSLGQFSRMRSDWDLMAQLARERDFDAFVQDTTLLPTGPQYFGIRRPDLPR